MLKGYRKIKYFTEQEAERVCDQRNGDNRRTNMVGSSYDTEQTPEGWVVNHPDYLDGYIKN